MSIELITFDLDNTVWESDSVLRRADEQTNAWVHKHVADYASLNEHRLYSLRALVVRERPDIVHDVSAFRVAFMERCFREVGVPSSDAARLAEEAFEVFIHWRCQVEPYPAAERLLASLSRKYQLASLTNGNADVARTSLDQFFSFNLSAADAGAAKPATQIFHLALELGGVTQPINALHIGDSLREDIEGAANAGMKTIWLDHDHVQQQTNATAVVHDLMEVEAAIELIESTTYT